MQSSAALGVGQMAPDFTLKGPGGQPVTLAEYRGRNPVVLVFFPLAFSPVCSHQLPAIEKEMPRMAALGAVVLGVSVDSHWANSAFADRLQLTFPLLSDFSRRTSADYGVLLEKSGHSGRAVFVVDREGRIAYKDQSVTPDVVPDNRPLIAALEELR
ncbi:MAG TPA: redoxin domain-containing protein [Candidatus Eisenbacteria bacterium]|nr:redoxin domain-containing protein [Candidatus Eisenbacteria bacterium]